jgi:tetratricopeptide (TPR) repeat protein
MRWIPLALGIALCACSTDMAISSIESDLKAERIDEAVRKVDALAAQQPNSYRIQYLRGLAHAEAAIRRLYAKDEPAYTQHLDVALDGYSRALRFDPRRAAPHSGVAILLFHQGNLQGALEEFRVARLLEPMNPAHYANLAQVYLYMGRVNRARTMVERGRKLGLHPALAETLEMLASWRQGDLVDARDLFDTASQNEREFRAVQRWLQDDPTVPADFDTFDELTAYCCSAITCGPYMRDACERMQLEVKEREVAAETLRRERAAVLERRRELLKTFGGRREIEVEGEEAEEGAEDPGSSDGGSR